jgi:hypothetical protein
MEPIEPKLGVNKVSMTEPKPTPMPRSTFTETVDPTPAPTPGATPAETDPTTPAPMPESTPEPPTPAAMTDLAPAPPSPATIDLMAKLTSDGSAAEDVESPVFSSPTYNRLVYSPTHAADSPVHLSDLPLAHQPYARP